MKPMLMAMATSVAMMRPGWTGDVVDDLAVEQDQGPVRVGGGLGVVGDHDDALAQFVDAASQVVQQRRAGLGVQGAGGFVGEDHVGTGDHGAGHGDALLLAAGQLAGTVVEALGQAEGVDELGEEGLVRLLAGQFQRQQDVLLSGQGGQQVEGLEDETDALPAEEGELLVVEGVELLATQHHPARGDLVQPGQAVHQGGLAGARGAHDGGEGAPGEGDVDAVEGGHLGLSGAVDLAQVDGLGHQFLLRGGRGDDGLSHDRGPFRTGMGQFSDPTASA